MNSSAEAYDSFAWFYNRYWGNRWAKQIVPVLDQLVLAENPPPARVLDLCCGTGQMAAILTDRDYQVTGVDNSPQMLSYARANAPEAEFIEADARAFALSAQCDIALSLFDSLNHIMTLPELTSVFTNVCRALRPGGMFFFDLNCEEGYIGNWKGGFPIVGDDHVLAVQASYDPPTRTGKMSATMFRLTNSVWTRTDCEFVQHCYTDDELNDALSTAGFAEIEIRKSDVDFGWKGLSRFFITAQRK